LLTQLTQKQILNCSLQILPYSGIIAEKQMKSVFSEASSATQREAQEMLKLFQFGVQYIYPLTSLVNSVEQTLDVARMHPIDSFFIIKIMAKSLFYTEGWVEFESYLSLLWFSSVYLFFWNHNPGAQEEPPSVESVLLQ